MKFNIAIPSAKTGLRTSMSGHSGHMLPKGNPFRKILEFIQKKKGKSLKREAHLLSPTYQAYLELSRGNHRI
ncbi:hypothetical protein [Aureibacter tunicatorum]|uniref:Uncharacterized protein n=1 Tax=Aureibacter tunicatorum TaxID=866807 RepID=A0AAE3XKK4_9BACT|nr:hypothetical protein [Aureibacter tunicatorum]MDR6238235.1 hypothetical protein [Aureibacter tunicatorum]BDD03268.1 hypothetical protein AUTU_07510 [Aureibacter tunicatorum]